MTVIILLCAILLVLLLLIPGVRSAVLGLLAAVVLFFGLVPVFSGTLDTNNSVSMIALVLSIGILAGAVHRFFKKKPPTTGWHDTTAGSDPTGGGSTGSSSTALCPNCGATINRWAKACPECGAYQ